HHVGRRAPRPEPERVRWRSHLPEDRQLPHVPGGPDRGHGDDVVEPEASDRRSARVTATLARMWLMLACVLLASCARQASQPGIRSESRLFERAGLAMGSELKLTAWSNDEASVERLFDQVFARFERLDAMMSVWRQGSDIIRLNDAAGEHPVHVASEVLEAL